MIECAAFAHGSIVDKDGRERRRAPIPRRHWKTTTVIGALWLDGLTALMKLNGAMNSAVFLVDVEQVLVLAVQINESLHLGNARSLDDHLLAAVADRPEVRHVLVVSAVKLVDASALQSLEVLTGRLKDVGRRSTSRRREEAGDGPARAQRLSPPSAMTALTRGR